jgi:hypothetical protein
MGINTVGYANRAEQMGRVVLLGVMVLAGLAGGCRSVSRGITESVLERREAKGWRVHYGSRVLYTLTDDMLTDVEFEGSTISGNTVVRFQRGLGPQAQCVAETTERLLSTVSERTGVAISTRTTAYLLRFDRRPQCFDITLHSEPNEFPLPLFVETGQESCEAILAQNHSYPYMMMHELVETSLVGRTGGQVLPDLSGRMLGMRVHINNYTRWFREGLANYAGYVAYEALSPGIPGEQRLYHRQTLLHTQPFTSLAKVGGGLFSWPQSPADEREGAYYNAALGLFLLIADTCGEQAIRDIVGEIAQRETVDRRDLVEITSQVIGTDVRRLAADFEFPTLGLEADRLSPALALNRGIEVREGIFVQTVHKGSAAEKAGLREKDVIVAVGDLPVANPLDFELGLFKARKQPATQLTVHRQGTGTLTLELPLRGPAQDPSQGRRRGPPQKGQVKMNMTRRS